MYVIITARSLIWMLCSLLATLLILGALVSPSWLETTEAVAQFENETILYTPSIGIYAKCGKPFSSTAPSCTSLAVRGFATDSSVMPTIWKVAIFVLAFGLTIMVITVFASLVSFCFQSVFRKSIFTLSGTAQSIAGICYIFGAMLYPMAWGHPRVQKLCGRDASPFYPDDCSLSAGIWLMTAGTALTFLSACLSIPAEKSTSSDKVQDQIYEGNTLICLP